MNKKRLYWLCQILGWLAMVTIEMVNYTFFIVKQFDKGILTYFLFTALLGLIFSHILKIVLRRSALFYKPALTIWIIAFVCTLVISFAIVIIDNGFTALYYHSLRAFNMPFLTILSYIINWMRYVGVWVIIYFLYKIMEVNNALKQEKLNVENAAKTAELELLKSQLNPHFLFNALNSIMALVSIDQQKSRDAILLLSDLLRFTLNYGKEKEIRLEEELAETRKYLLLEQIRFGSKLIIDYQVDENTLNAMIPPASILTLTENAIKHGRHSDNGIINIIISATIIDDRIYIAVKNTGNLTNARESNGLGLPIVKKRLAALYGNEGSFFITGKEGWVEAIIQIPQL